MTHSVIWVVNGTQIKALVTFAYNLLMLKENFWQNELNPFQARYSMDDKRHHGFQFEHIFDFANHNLNKFAKAMP